MEMLPGLERELCKELRDEGVATREGVDALALELRAKCLAGPLGHDVDWYADDERLQKAVEETLSLARELGPGGKKRAVVLAKLESGTLRRYGFEPAAFTKSILKALALLEDPNPRRSEAGLVTLGDLPKEPLAQHARSVVRKLDDADGGVRYMALATLGKLGSAALARYARPYVLDKLADRNDYVRKEATETLGKLSPETLAQLATHVLPKLDDHESYVRLAAVEALGKLAPSTLAQHADLLVRMLDDPAWSTRMAAVDTVGKLEGAMLGNRAEAVMRKLEDPELHVRQRAILVLNKLEPATIVRHSDTFRALLAHLVSGVRVAGLEALCRAIEIEPALKARNIKAIRRLEEDPEREVRKAAQAVLVKLGLSFRNVQVRPVTR